MDGQMNMFDYLDEQIGFHHCSECENAKYKETMKDGNPIYWCNEVRSYITIYSGNWLCAKKGNLFKRRGAQK